jgi:hypothetical protein
MQQFVNGLQQVLFAGGCVQQFANNLQHPKGENRRVLALPFSLALGVRR